MAFTLEERQHMGIHGLLPPAVLSQDIQVLRVMANFHRAQGKSIFYINSLK
jgi:malate dehydrogenase (oxaloacetate-decarboxylating)(NADP+)